MALPLDQQNIIAILGIQDLPEERKLTLLDKITTLVEKRLLVRIFDSLSPENQEKLGGLLDKDDQEGLNAFLEQYVPDLAGWLEEETNRLKGELAGVADSVA